jgi:hypothetical protein
MSNSSKIRDFFKVQGTKRSDSKGKEDIAFEVTPLVSDIQIKASPLGKKGDSKA